MKFITRLVIVALALILVTSIVPGIEITGFVPALVAALLLGVLNAIVRPILVLITFPITIVTLGLFIFVINAALFLVVASWVDGFSISGFSSALFGSILVSIVSGITSKYI